MAFILLRAQPASSSSSIGLEMSVINGQPMLTVEDTTRNDKRLSISEQNFTFAENRLNDNDWIQIGNANDADSSYIADFDGTIVYASGHCEHTGANSKQIHLVVNGVDKGALGLFIGGSNATFINNTLDTDFIQGDTIRLQAKDGSGGAIQDTVIKLAVKWRA